MTATAFERSHSGISEQTTESEIPLFLDVEEFGGTPGARTLTAALRAEVSPLRERVVERVTEQVQLPTQPSPPEARQKVLQAWLGVVSELVDEKEFVSVVKDQSDPTRPDERITIDIDEVDPQDRKFLTKGAVFYWYIFEEFRKGTRRIVYDLRFRRVPAWSENDLTDIRQRAEQRARRFGVHDPAATR